MTVGHLIFVPVPQVGAKEGKSNKTLSRDELGLCYSYGEKKLILVESARG